MADIIEHKAHPVFRDEPGVPARARIEYDLLLDEFDLALRTGFDSYWAKSVAEREMMLAADQTLKAIHAMSEYDAAERAKAKAKRKKG